MKILPGMVCCDVHSVEMEVATVRLKMSGGHIETVNGLRCSLLGCDRIFSAQHGYKSLDEAYGGGERSPQCPTHQSPMPIVRGNTEGELHYACPEYACSKVLLTSTAALLNAARDRDIRMLFSKLAYLPPDHPLVIESEQLVWKHKDAISTPLELQELFDKVRRLP